VGEGGLIRPAVVLVEPVTPGNVGAVARGMANFELDEMILAGETPLPGRRDFVAARVEGRVVLDAARRAPDLATALETFQVAVAVTRRSGKHRPTDLTPATLPSFLASLPGATRVALVFGRETDGLRNDEVLLCGRLLTIPSSPDAPSLNLAQAVAVVAATLFTGSPRSSRAFRRRPEAPAELGDVEAFYAALETALGHIGFLEGDRAADTMASLRRILGRANLTPADVRLLRGLVRKIERAASG